jgi:acetoacetate decarboxylase
VTSFSLAPVAVAPVAELPMLAIAVVGTLIRNLTPRPRQVHDYSAENPPDATN